MRRRTPALLSLALAGSVVPAITGGSSAGAAAAADPALVGAFALPFEEAGPRCRKDREGRSICKPAAGSLGVLPTGNVLYWDALEGMEDVDANVVAEYGHVAQNDQSRVLDMRSGRPRWSTPTPFDGGANPRGNDADAEYLPVVPHNNDEKRNDGDLFCSDQVFLADGRLIAVGGTSYYLEPGNSGTPVGATELEGLKNSRVFDPVSRTWKASGAMKYGRWYPSLVTLGDGKVFVASGVTKLIKPVYAGRPQDSGTNVRQTETYDPRTGRWTENKPTAQRSLPLFPRLHLLPNGKVYYDAAGQTFNPNGQSYDEATWNLAAAYDPKSQTWEDLGIPALGGGAPGFRGSAFSQMLPLRPDARGQYTKAEFLGAGGVLGTTPGAYLANNTSTINTIDMTGGQTRFSSAPTKGTLNAPRWYGTGVTLPTGQVIVFNGADRDEVVNPGSGAPVMTPELFDPRTGTWTELAKQKKGRTYHNTATLLPDGRVLVGGHAPIGTGYAFPTNAGRTALGLSDAFRDPSFEIYSPPYLFRGPRPVITKAPVELRAGKAFAVDTTTPGEIESLVLVRNTALTHLVDGDQRVVEVEVQRRAGGVWGVMPTNTNALPPGPYLMFVNKKTAKGPVPSVARQVFVNATPPAATEAEIARTTAASLRTELAALRAAR